jgi:hypothetical protein
MRYLYQHSHLNHRKHMHFALFHSKLSFSRGRFFSALSFFITLSCSVLFLWPRIPGMLIVWESTNSSADVLLSRIELDSVVIERCAMFTSAADSSSSSSAVNAMSAENRPNSFSYLVGCFARSIEIGDQIAANEKVCVHTHLAHSKASGIWSDCTSLASFIVSRLGASFHYESSFCDSLKRV